MIVQHNQVKANYASIKWLLFDADNTLLNFTKACRLSFWKTLNDHQILCTEEVYQLYKKINAFIWKEFEEGKISALEIRKQRFNRLFEELNIVGYDGFDMNKKYLENLILFSEAYDGVIDLIKDLKKEYIISVVTNGLKEVQKPRLRRLKLYDHFDSIVVSDEIGVAKPHTEFFHHVNRTIPVPPDKAEIMIIGDSLNSDIKGGLDFGIQTCWINHGNSNSSNIKPHFELNNIHGLKSLLKGGDPHHSSK